MAKDFVAPKALGNGDKIVIVSPAGVVDPDFIDRGAEALRRGGFDVIVAPHAKGQVGTFAGTLDDRLGDLVAAWTNPEVGAILCARGGYGAVHLLGALDHLDLDFGPDNAKWLIGFSDITALHCYMHSHGVQSIHSPMVRHLSRLGGIDADAQALMAILRGCGQTYTFVPDPRNRHGCAKGVLVGGNIAVFEALVGTPYDYFRDPDEPLILFIEDISEPVYRVERIFWQMRYAGILDRLKGLVVGQFTNYTPDANGRDMETMIAQMVAPYHFPVAYGMPIGHVDHNIPLVVSRLTTLTVDADSVRLSQ